ncbi:hypothetical protein BDN72DRAFT_904052 [Pluteus cervinus]|uniref:Uncharacterized protein n=1 Tax=Pluteus cervinus TaxID=181527 RepID=A0ACD3A867_9AGAR|nr:hypothetical protein BDN72DRAFT_904052 [Pluteus cervinus]
MNPHVLESILNAQKHFCMLLKADRCSVGTGAAEKEFVPGQFVLVCEKPSKTYRKASIRSIFTDLATQETFVVVEWLFGKEDLACLKELHGPVKSCQELQNLLGPHELLRTNATSCISSSDLEDHLTIHKYLDTSPEFLAGHYQNCWYYRMELHFIGNQFSSADLRVSIAEDVFPPLISIYL